MASAAQPLEADAPLRAAQVLDALPGCAVAALDAAGRVRLWSAGAEALTGFAAAERIGAGYESLFAAGERAAGLPAQALQLALGAPLPLEGWRERRDGSRYWVEATLQAVRGADARLSGFVELARDAGARREHLQALRESQVRLSGILASAMDAVLSVDETQHIVLANAAAERTFGWTRAALLGMPLSRLIPERLCEQLMAPAPSFEPGAGGAIREPQVFRALRADGREFPAEASVSCARVGGAALFTVILRDVTDRLTAEAEIRRLARDLESRVDARTAELRRSVRELESYSYTIAHDLRAPLRALDAYSVKLERDHAGALTPEAAALAGRIRGAARQMGHLVDALLQFAHLGRVELVRENVDMRALALAAVAAARAEFPRFEASVGELPRAVCDPALLAQVWTNLVHNAAKFSARVARPRIEIGSYLDNGINYFVADNGVGFDTDYSEKLFGVFQRLHGMREFEGTGAGLAIVKRIIERHGGRVRGEAVAGGGAKFSFALRADAIPAPEIALKSGENRPLT